MWEETISIEKVFVWFRILKIARHHNWASKTDFAYEVLCSNIFAFLVYQFHIDICDRYSRIARMIMFWPRSHPGNTGSFCHSVDLN